MPQDLIHSELSRNHDIWDIIQRWELRVYHWRSHRPAQTSLISDSSARYIVLFWLPVSLFLHFRTMPPARPPSMVWSWPYVFHLFVHLQMCVLCFVYPTRYLDQSPPFSFQAALKCNSADILHALLQWYLVLVRLTAYHNQMEHAIVCRISSLSTEEVGLKAVETVFDGGQPDT